jgi:DNA-binding MarR family transcriptional regulator
MVSLKTAPPLSPMNDSSQHPGDRTIGWALTQAARLHRTHLNTKLAELGLFAGQEQVLDALQSQGALTISDLAAVLRVRAPTASKMVTRLAVLGFVQRESDRKDARTVRVRLTRKGRMAVTRLHRLWDEVERDMVKDLSSTEQGQLHELLLRAATNLSPGLEPDQQEFVSAHSAADRPMALPHQTSSSPDVREQPIPRPHC